MFHDSSCRIWNQWMESSFTPIGLEDYIKKHWRSNPPVTSADRQPRLEYAIAARRFGKRCSCGARIWIAGSAEAGLSCFCCITGDRHPSDDYEVDIACSTA